jgi:hypothetical protein
MGAPADLPPHVLLAQTYVGQERWADTERAAAGEVRPGL